MREPKQRMLVLSVRNGCMGCVLLIGGVVKDRRMSISGVATIDTAAKALRSWIKDYEPDIVISENPSSAVRKGIKQRAILKRIAHVAETSLCLNIVVTRKRMHKNRYKHANALGEHFKSVKHLVPKEPPIWMPEPRKMVYFEALSMAAQVLDKH